MKITSVLFLLMLSYSIPEAVVSPDFLTEFVVIVFSSRDHHHLMHALFRLNPLFMRSNSRLELSNFLSMKSLFPANFLCESLTKHDFVVVGKTWQVIPLRDMKTRPFEVDNSCRWKSRQRKQRREERLWETGSFCRQTSFPWQWGWLETKSDSSLWLTFMNHESRFKERVLVLLPLPCIMMYTLNQHMKLLSDDECQARHNLEDQTSFPVSKNSDWETCIRDTHGLWILPFVLHLHLSCTQNTRDWTMQADLKLSSLMMFFPIEKVWVKRTSSCSRLLQRIVMNEKLGTLYLLKILQCQEACC